MGIAIVVKNKQLQVLKHGRLIGYVVQQVSTTSNGAKSLRWMALAVGRAFRAFNTQSEAVRFLAA